MLVKDRMKEGLVDDKAGSQRQDKNACGPEGS